MLYLAGSESHAPQRALAHNSFSEARSIVLDVYGLLKC